MAHPVTAVQEFFQKAGQTGPEALVYEFSDYCTDTPVPEKRFVCSLKTPRVVSTEQGIVCCVLEANVFQGEGRKKADAKRDAAANALAFLQQQPLWEAQHRLPPLRDVLAACFTNQGILQDPDLKAWWAFCQQYPLSTDTPTAAAGAAGGEAVPMTCPVSLPLTALTHSKHLVGWIKQQQQQQQQGNQGSSSGALDVLDTVQLMWHIQGLLHQAAASGTLPEGVSVDSHALSVSRQQQQQAAAGASGIQRSRDQDAAAASPPVSSTLAHEVWDESPAAVLVPADTRSTVSQVQLQSPAGAAAAAHGSPDLLHQVCALLHLPQPQSLVVWGRVGPRVSHPALPAEWAATQQQWERVHAAIQQQQQQQGKDKGQQEAPQGQGGGGGGGVGDGGVLAHLSGGTSVLLGARKPQQARSQQQQQEGEAGASGGGPPRSAVVLGAARQASASTLQNEPQPPKKRLHTAGEAEAGTAAAAEAAEVAGAAEPSTTTLSRASLLAVGGGPAVMDWEGSTQQGSEEVKGPPGAARSILPPDTPTDSDTAAAAGGSSSTLGPHMIDIGPPMMYSVFCPDQGSAEAAGLNLRASWLAGRRVYGPVLLAGSGIMRGAGTYNVVKWRSYTADTFWAAVSGLLPAAAHSSRAAHGGCTLTRLPTQYRSPCWVGAHPRHLLETYTTKHAHWVTRVCPQLPSLQQQQQQLLQAAQPAAAPAAAGEGGGRGRADSSSSSKDNLPVLMGYTISVEDAAEPASNSPTGFNCRAQLRVYPAAATAAAAAADSTGSGSSAGDSWLRGLGCGSEAEGLAVLENSSVAVGSEAGPCAAEAHVEVQDGQLVVVADSGLALGPVDAQNIAALAALHLLTALEAAALTGSRPEPPTTAGAAAATEAAAAELEALVVAAETEAAAAASGAADELLTATAGTADVAAAAAAVNTAVAAAGGSEMDVDGGSGAGSLDDVEVLWSAAGGDADGSGLLQPAVGRVAKINAHLYLPNSSSTAPAGSQPTVRPSDPGCYSLDALRCYSLLLGSGAVVDQAEALVRGLRVGGAAQRRVRLCLQGPDLLHRFKPVEAVLAVQLLEVSLPKPSTAAAAAGGGGGEAAAGPALFDPPLGLQRRRLVSELVRRCSMASVVDLGCGDGGFIKHLLCEAGFTALASIVGVDVSARELAAAARRLQGMQSHWMALQPSTSPVAAGAAAAGGVSAGSGVAAGAATPAGVAEGAAAAGYEGEGSTVSGLGAPFGRLTSTAASVEAQSRQQEQLQQSQGVAGTPSEGVSVIQGTADSFTSMSGDSFRQQQQQQQQGLSAAGVSSAASDGTSCAIQLQLLQGDLTNPGLASPSSGFWQAHGLNPGSVDLAACIEVLEHLEPQAVDALGHSVLGGLRPKAAVFSTPNWEYNVVLRAINTGVTWPGPPGRDGQPLRHGDHRFEWSRAEFRAWAAAMAGRHGYSVAFVDIGRALREQEVLAAAGGLQEKQQQAGSGGVAAAAAEARAAGAADVVLSALPSVTAAAGPSALPAAEAATAAVVQASVQGGSSAAAAVELLERVVQAGEQQEQQQQALVAGLAWADGRQGNNDAAERQQVEQDVAMQDPFQDPFQQASMGPGSLGGASQAAIFRLLPGAEAAADGAAAAEQALEGGGGGGGRGLSVVWGPMTAVLRVGSFQGASEPAGAEDSGVLPTVETEHF